MHFNSFGAKFQTTFVVCFIFVLTNYRFERNLYVMLNITKTYLYNFDPLKPDFYIVKLGFTGVYIIFLISAQNIYIIFLISAQNIDCGYSLEPPRRGGSNEYHNLCFEQKYEKISEFFYLKIFSFWRWNFLYIWIGVFSYRRLNNKQGRSRWDGYIWMWIPQPLPRTGENVPSDMCALRRLNSACACAQSDQSLHFLHEGALFPWLSKKHPEKIMIRQDDYAGWSETLICAYFRRYCFVVVWLILRKMTKYCLCWSIRTRPTESFLALW